MIGTTLVAISDHIEALASETGDFTLVCARYGDRPVPAWVDTDAVDPQLGTHVDATPQVAATDGGIVNAGDDAEIVDDTDDDVDDGRPDECDCGAWNADAALPCWPCYREGFEEPASAEE